MAPHSRSTKRPNGSTLLPGPGLTNSGATKRVRRIQVELPFFRDQVHKLELQLVRLKLQKTELHIRIPRTKRLNIEDKSQVASVWNDLADRQFNERLQAEKEKQQLKNSSSEMWQLSVKLSVKLQKILQKTQEMTGWLEASARGAKLQQRFWNFSTDLEDKILSEQLTTVKRLYLELQQQWPCQNPSRMVHYYCDLSMGQEVAMHDPMQMWGSCSKLTVPFNLDVVVEAYWQLFGRRYGEQSGISISDSDCQKTDIIARSFACRADFDGFIAQTLGKYTCQKYVSDKKVTLVLVESVDVSVLGVKFHGLQYHKKGYVKLRRVIRQGLANNLLQLPWKPTSKRFLCFT